MVFTKWWPGRKTDQRKSIKYQLSFLRISQGPYLGSWPLWVRVNIGTKQCLLRNPFGFKMSSTPLYGWKQLGSASHCWTATQKFQCQTSREMEALQPPLNNTKTNCFIFFSHRSNMHEANWQWDQIASFSLFLSPHRDHPLRTNNSINHTITLQCYQTEVCDYMQKVFFCVSCQTGE